MLYDYRSLSVAEEILSAVSAYSEISVIAWSMGVWAFEQLSPQLQFSNRQAIAINGSGEPVHEQYGISPSVYQATIDRFSAQGRKKFFVRLCGSRHTFEQFQHCFPQRPLSEQHEELIAIQQHSTVHEPRSQTTRIPPPFSHALISTQDRIIPSENQRRYWERTTPYSYIDAPHFPFFLWKSWNAILDYAEQHS